jgi:hypothetical protein
LCLIKLSIIDIHFAKPTSLSFHSNSVIGFNTIFHFVSTLFFSAPISKLTDDLFCLMIEFEVSAFEWIYVFWTPSYLDVAGKLTTTVPGAGEAISGVDTLIEAGRHKSWAFHFGDAVFVSGLDNPIILFLVTSWESILINFQLLYQQLFHFWTYQLLMVLSQIMLVSWFLIWWCCENISEFLLEI